MTNRLWKWGPAVLLGLVTLTFSLRFHYQAPYHDHWDIVPLFARLQDGLMSFGDLFELHGNHWHASGYLVLLGLGEVTAMGHWAETLASVIFAAFAFLALARMLERSIALLAVPQAAIWAFGFSAFFLFSMDQAANWLWGWQLAVFINIAGVMLAIERFTVGGPTLVNTVLAAIASTAAIYAFGTGWVLIPIGYVLLLSYGAMRSRQGVGSLIIWTLFASLMGWHFSLASTSASAMYAASSLPNFAAPETLAGLTHYAVNFVASPIVRFARDISIPVTLIGVGILAWSTWTLTRVDKANGVRGIAPFLSLAAFAAGSGLLTAIGRYEAFGVKQAFVSRYISFGTPFWIAVFVLAVFAIAKTGSKSHRILFGVLGLMFVLKIGNIPSVVQKSVKISNQISVAAETLVENDPNMTPDQYSVLHSPLQTIEPQIEILRTHEASLFSHASEEDDD